MAASIEDLPFVEIGDRTLVAAIQKAVESAELMAGHRSTAQAVPGERSQRVGFATDASVRAVNALLAAASSRCMRAAPPADVDMVTDPTGNLIYRCQHKSPPHRWKLDGTILP